MSGNVKNKAGKRRPTPELRGAGGLNQGKTGQGATPRPLERRVRLLLCAVALCISLFLRATKQISQGKRHNKPPIFPIRRNTRSISIAPALYYTCILRRPNPTKPANAEPTNQIADGMGVIATFPFVVTITLSIDVLPHT